MRRYTGKKWEMTKHRAKLIFQWIKPKPREGHMDQNHILTQTHIFVIRGMGIIAINILYAIILDIRRIDRIHPLKHPKMQASKWKRKYDLVQFDAK